MTTTIETTATETTIGEALVRRYYGRALNTGQFDELDELLSEDFHDHEALRGIPPTRHGLETKYSLLRAGFPDLRFAVEDIFTAGDRVCARVTVEGTHTGNFMGRPPTGATFRVDSVGIFRITDRRIAEHWGVFDQFAMLSQLGAFAG